MIDQRVAKYEWGQGVQASLDLYNDGSYPNTPPGTLLAACGDSGEIVNVGMHVESNTPIYLVEFPNGHVVGCLEEELSLG